MYGPLGEVDILKRFRFLLINHPELRRFEPLVKMCKAARDKIEHHDDTDVTYEELALWRVEVDQLIETGADTFNRREKMRETGELEFALEAAFETELADKDRMAGELSDLLRSKALDAAQCEQCVTEFLGAYEEYAELHSLEEARNSNELWLQSETAIGLATIRNAHLNGWNEARLEDIATDLADRFLAERASGR